MAPMEGVDGVFHVAAWCKVGAKDNSTAIACNIDGTDNVLETMRELSIAKGVYTSTLAVFSDTHGNLVDKTYRYDGPHLSEYDRAKWVAHYEIAEPMMKAGLPLVIVMPGVVYGPDDHSDPANGFRDYLQGKVPVLPQHTAYCWAHVDDIAKSHIRAMEIGKPGEAYILAGPHHTMIEAFGMAEQITGVKAPRLHIPPGMMKAMSGLMGVVGSIVTLPPSYTAESLRVVAGTTYLGDNRKARRELGFDPRSLRDGLPEAMMVELDMND
ncbi:MAG: NAD-dependent epimerase/dehydratase family protein [Proteobacteria bacterium]|nr:NAD-dependent epimerase/dehydratase family protein [Pseudomonadota bacterium]